MVRRFRFALAAATAAAFVAGDATAQAQVGRKKTGDKRVAAALDKAGLKYEVTDSGDFKLLYELDDDRTHVAIIESKTEKLDDLEIREVWAIGLKSEEELDAETANNLLVANGQVKVGAWQVVEGEEEYNAIFSAQVDADADSDTLAKVIVAVVQTADAKELELTEEDEY